MASIVPHDMPTRAIKVRGSKWGGRKIKRRVGGGVKKRSTAKGKQRRERKAQEKRILKDIEGEGGRKD